MIALIENIMAAGEQVTIQTYTSYFYCNSYIEQGHKDRMYILLPLNYLCLTAPGDEDEWAKECGRPVDYVFYNLYYL